MYKMSQMIFMDLNHNKENNQEVMNIQDFVKIQEIKSESTQKMIEECAHDCHNIYKKSLETQLATLREKVADSTESDKIVEEDEDGQIV